MKSLRASILSTATIALAVFVALPATADAPSSVDEITEMLASGDGEQRVVARKHAAEFGPEAVAPVAALFDSEDRNTYIAAKWALRSIVHSELRPQDDKTARETARKRIAKEVAGLLSSENSSRVRAEALYLISLCGNEEHVPAIAQYLSDEKMVDHACYALVRIPDKAALDAMLDALEGADTELAVKLIHSIAQREEPAARKRLEALAENGDKAIAEAASKSLSIRDLRIDAKR